MSCSCAKYYATICLWCSATLACRGCHHIFMKTFYLAEKEVPDWKDHYDLDFPFSCEECFNEHKKLYTLIKTFEPPRPQ